MAIVNVCVALDLCIPFFLFFQLWVGGSTHSVGLREPMAIVNVCVTLRLILFFGMQSWVGGYTGSIGL